MPRTKEQQAVYRKKVRLAALAVYGGACGRCGFSDERALQFDHVHGDGHDEAGGRGHAFYKKVVAEHGNGRYQVLCANCNWIKRSENKEYGTRSE